MSKIYVFAALEAEANTITRLVDSRSTSQKYVSGRPFAVGANELHLFLSGMGPQKARASATDVLGPWLGSTDRSSVAAPPKPDLLLVVGLCGGLTESIREGEIVSYASCLSDRNEPALTCGKSVSECLPEILGAHGIRCQMVNGITSGRIATNRAERDVLGRSGAVVVDMESYELLALAASAGIPAAVLRVVSDCIDRELPDFNPAIDPEGNLDGWRALRIALGSPLRTLRVIAANKRALRQLAEALRPTLGAQWPKANALCGT